MRTNGNPSAISPADIHYQAHRGSLYEAPENTLAAYRHAWACPGAVPEVDVCRTRDGELVCMHDDTPARTTDAPEPFASRKISEIDLTDLRRWDAGAQFDASYAGKRMPLLSEVLAEMRARPERQVYLDLKDVGVPALLARVEEAGLRNQVLFAVGRREVGERIRAQWPVARTMTWISGEPTTIPARFDAMADGGFAGITQVQLHLRTENRSPRIRYALDAAFLLHAVARTQAAGVDLMLRPFDFDARSLAPLLAIGVRWFVADEPRRFSETVREALR